MSKIIEFGPEARKKLVNGIDKLSNAVTSTLGPNGRNVVISNNQGYPQSTKDGVTVAKTITLEDPIEELGAQLVKQAAIKTADGAGDGTTTSTLLAQEMVKNGLTHLNNGVNAVKIKRDIDTAVKEVVKELRKTISQDISSEDQLKQVATISANNDPEVGELIATAMQKVGREGVVHIEESKSGETYLETVEGMQFDRGYKSHYFVTDNNTMTCTLENPLILIADKRFTSIKELLPVLEAVSNQGKPLFIIAEDLEGEALATLIVNKMRGTIKVAAVKAPDFGDRRKLLLDDIAPFEQEKLQERLAKFVGGVAIIHVGGNTETEVKEKKDRVDDALQATKAAIEEGIVPGGGSALLYAREAITNKDTVGGNIVFKACASPFMKILTNAGYEEMESYQVINNLFVVRDNWRGYNLETQKFVDMKQAGIIDPTKVTRTAIENAASVAGTILLTECTVVDKPEETKQDDMMAGMGGMY